MSQLAKWAKAVIRSLAGAIVAAGARRRAMCEEQPERAEELLSVVCADAARGAVRQASAVGNPKELESHYVCRHTRDHLIYYVQVKSCLIGAELVVVELVDGTSYTSRLARFGGAERCWRIKKRDITSLERDGRGKCARRYRGWTCSGCARYSAIRARASGGWTRLRCSKSQQLRRRGRAPSSRPRRSRS